MSTPSRITSPDGDRDELVITLPRVDLPQPELADEPDRLPGHDVEAHAVDGLDRRPDSRLEMLDDVDDAQERLDRRRHARRDCDDGVSH